MVSLPETKYLPPPQSRLAFTATYAHVRQGNIRNAGGEPVKLGDWVINDERAIIMNYVRNFLPWDLLVLIPLPQVRQAGRQAGC